MYAANSVRQGFQPAARQAVIDVDIDHFKPYNDHHGHVEGDRCIRSLAQALTQVMHRAARSGPGGHRTPERDAAAGQGCPWGRLTGREATQPRTLSNARLCDPTLRMSEGVHSGRVGPRQVRRRSGLGFDNHMLA